jgi:hypothetical protein
MNTELVNVFKHSVRYTSRSKFKELDEKFPEFKFIYEDYLKSESFRNLINTIRGKYDSEYLKLFFRHAINFINYFLKERDIETPKKEKVNRTILKDDLII